MIMRKIAPEILGIAPAPTVRRPRSGSTRTLGAGVPPEFVPALPPGYEPSGTSRTRSAVPPLKRSRSAVRRGGSGPGRPAGLLTLEHRSPPSRQACRCDAPNARVPSYPIPSSPPYFRFCLLCPSYLQSAELTIAPAAGASFPALKNKEPARFRAGCVTLAERAALRSPGEHVKRRGLESGACLSL